MYGHVCINSCMGIRVCIYISEGVCMYVGGYACRCVSVFAGGVLTVEAMNHGMCFGGFLSSYLFFFGLPHVTNVQCGYQEAVSACIHLGFISFTYCDANTSNFHCPGDGGGSGCWLTPCVARVGVCIGV